MSSSNLLKILSFSIINVCLWLFHSSAQDKISHSIYLAGNTIGNTDKNIKGFLNQLEETSQPSSFVFLGDFSQPHEALNEKKKKEFIIYPDQFIVGSQSLVFAMGPEEWLNGKSNGKKNVKDIVKYVHKKFDGQQVYITDWGCPGPIEIELNDQVTIILIDTQWWLHPNDTRFGKCGIEEMKDVYIWLQDALRRNEGKITIVAGHHPVNSFGVHGGSLPLTTNVLAFPYAIYKNAIGGRQDMAHPEYKNLSKQLHALFNQFPNLIYASAHENSLQYFMNGKYHQVISGSLSKQSYVNQNKTEFGSNQAGIARIDVYENSQVVLNFFSLKNGAKKPVFSKTLFQKKLIKEEDIAIKRDNLFASETYTTFASKQYLGSKSYEKWMGKNYRDVWATPIEVPVFNILKEQGGLEILKRGGGQQTKSIRMENKDGQQFVLRSLEKYAEGALPKEMENTFAVDIVQDQISASNPYGALPAASLAEAAGVFHTNPKIVYVPEDPLLKQYKADLAGGLFLYEERPAGNCSEIKSFGYSKDVVNTAHVIEKTTESEDHKVDQYAVLRARLLDLYINDWDRHDDQWRWASFKKDGLTTYQPIPRDRDQVFFVNQGIIPKLASMKWLMPKIQNFQPKTKNVEGLAFNARYFDRTFLNQMEWKNWSDMADTLVARITNEDIEKAMLAFPPEIRPLCADSIKNTLIGRKKYLKEMAYQLYSFLSEKVNIVGTNRKDLFEINRINDQETEVSVWHLKKKGEIGKQVFHRVFKTNETKELVCYGLDEEDKFVIKGKVNKGPLVRIIGGTDKDVVDDQSKVNGLKKTAKIYDLKKSTVINSKGEAKKILSNNKIIHDYNRKSFKYDLTMPMVSIGYNIDDGVFLGGGFSTKVQKFRRENTTTVAANYAIKTSAFNIKYSFESFSTTNGFDVGFDVDIKAPNYTSNFYGLGNETKNEFSGEHKNYFTLRQQQYFFTGKVQKRFGKTTWERYEEDEANKDHPINEHKIGFSTSWQTTETEDTRSRFITNFATNRLSPDDLELSQYLAFKADYLYRNVNKSFMPTRGFEAYASAAQYLNLDGNAHDFSKLSGYFSTYISFRKNPRTVFAIRVGAEKNSGNYPFYEAAKLGGKTNLRGFRKTRFYGDESAYLNAEARLKLLDFKNYLITGEMGLLLFNDLGRVWFENEPSTQWHQGYGGGIWISPFKMAVLTTTFNSSKEDNLFQFNFKYLF